jgi:hypothetical protein
MAHATSNDADQKLQAVINHDWPETDNAVPRSYVQACGRWFAALSADDKVVAAMARAAFEKGDEAEAKKAASALPPAPAWQP